MLFNIAVDESGDTASSSARLIGSLGDGKLSEKLVKNLDGFLILGLGVSGVRGYGLHDVD